MKVRITAETNHRSFKNSFNEKHYARTQGYKVLLIDAKYYLEVGQQEGALACVNQCLKSVDDYIEQIIRADNSPAGWPLIDRLGLNTEEQQIKKIKNEILEERRSKQKKNGNGKNSNKKAGGNGGGGGGGGRGNNSNDGPCTYCASGYHSMGQCRILKADVANKSAVYNSQTKLWERKT